MNDYFVYIVKCRDKSYYNGVTNNIERRIEEHNYGLDVKCYTFTRRPVKLIFFERFNDINKAIEFEKKLKGWSRKKKEALITGKFDLLKEYSKCLNKTSHKNYR